MVVAVDNVLGEAYRPPLDESFYHLSEDEAAFFKSQTGIKDDEELKRHILKAQANAYEVGRNVRLCIDCYTSRGQSLHESKNTDAKNGTHRYIRIRVSVSLASPSTYAFCDKFFPHSCRILSNSSSGS